MDLNKDHQREIFLPLPLICFKLFWWPPFIYWLLPLLFSTCNSHIRRVQRRIQERSDHRPSPLTLRWTRL